MHTADAGRADASPRRVAATIVARNYLAHATVLHTSVEETNPGVDRVTLVVDGMPEDRERTGLGQVLLLADLDLPAEQLEPMVVMYSVLELCTAVKPALLRHLLGSGYEAVTYLDPDVLVTGSLDGVLDAAHRDGIALTPHALTGLPRDGRAITEKTVMRSGIFNLGFIAVGQGAAEFLGWWHERLVTQAVVDPEQGLFTDQRWVDWVPALFRHVVLRDPGLNVAYWNAHERELSLDADGRPLADGSPLVFFHFSGFDPHRPWSLSRYAGRDPRVLLSGSPALQALCEDYAARLLAAGLDDLASEPYGHFHLGDVELTPAIRTVYRRSLIGELPFVGAPRLPLSHPDELATWLNVSIRPTPWTTLTAAEYAFWLASPDLRASAPNPLSHSAAELRRAVAERQARTPDAVDRSVRAEHGWTVLAGGSAEPSSETRRMARLVADQLRDGGESVTLLDAVRTRGTRDVRWTGSDEDAGRRVLENVIVCVDAARLVGRELALQLEGCPGLRVGLWLGPDGLDIGWQGEALAGFDEIWVVSADLRSQVMSMSEVPVRRLEVTATAGEPGESRADAEDDGLLVVFELDSRVPAEVQRLGLAVDAYRLAVPEPGAHVLEVRAAGGRLRPADVDLARHVLDSRPDVRLTDEPAPDAPDPDVVLAVNPLAATGLSAVEALGRGGQVVVAEPWPGALDAHLPGVHPAARQGEGLDAPSVAAQLRAALATAAPDRPGRSPRLSVEGKPLATAVRRVTSRRGRTDAQHHVGLEAEVHRLREANARATAELAALRETKVFRYTRLARTAYASVLSWRRGSVRPTTTDG